MFGQSVLLHHRVRKIPILLSLCVVLFGSMPLLETSVFAKSKKPSGMATTALNYIQGLKTGDKVAVGQLDFACQYQLVSASQGAVTSLPDKSSPVYQDCWKPIQQFHEESVDQKARGMELLWPGKEKLVFLGKDFKRQHYYPSVFVSENLKESSAGGGFTVKVEKETALPPASFRLRPGGDIVATPAKLIQTLVTYKDPIHAPVSYEDGKYRWEMPFPPPRVPLKTITLKWVVLSNLKKLGFPKDSAVVNIPVAEAQANMPAIPHVADKSGLVPDTATWWGPKDSPDILMAAIGRASQLPDLNDRVGLLNRVLLVDPFQAEALTALSRDLYQAIMDDGATTLPVKISDKTLENRFLEFYWDTYAQQERMDISLGMEMGGFSKPTTADYLFRMIPAMEKLVKLRPDDLENRFRLGIAYRWNLDQLVAIKTHEALVKALPPERGALRARALLESAWSKITMVAFNRRLDNPIIREAHQQAAEAFTLSPKPLNKFVAEYTMAYSLVFAPDRDNKAILDHLTKAKEWYFKVQGSSPESWRVLVENETLKPLIDANPSFKHLVAAR